MKKVILAQDNFWKYWSGTFYNSWVPWEWKKKKKRLVTHLLLRETVCSGEHGEWWRGSGRLPSSAHCHPPLPLKWYLSMARRTRRKNSCTRSSERKPCRLTAELHNSLARLWCVKHQSRRPTVEFRHFPFWITEEGVNCWSAHSCALLIHLFVVVHSLSFVTHSYPKWLTNLYDIKAYNKYIN